MDPAQPSSCLLIDDSFGPHAKWCRGGFDFTLFFEETVLSILPLAILIAVVPLRSYYLLRKPPKTTKWKAGALKLALYLVLFALQASLLSFWALPPTLKTKASVAAASLSLVGVLAMSILSWLEHFRTVRPSSILAVYLFFSGLFDIARTRTLWLRNESTAMSGLFTAATVLKFVLLAAESAHKRKILNPNYASYPAEAISGVFNQSFFWWLNSLFRKGYSHMLPVEDLFDLDKHLQSEYLLQNLQRSWTKTSRKYHALFCVAVKTLRLPLGAGVFPRLCLTGFYFCQPLLINRAIRLSQEPVTTQSTQAGYGLIGAYVIVYVGIAVSTGQYQHLTYRAITMVRGGLISMLFNKATDLKITDADPASAMTLMSADIERIVQGWQGIHELWASLLEVVLAIVLLEQQLGPACAIPIVVAFLAMGGSMAVTSFVISRQAAWLEAIEKRISATSSMLNAMKGVKMCGLTDTLMDRIHTLRLEELEISKRFRRLLIWNIAFAYIAPVASPVVAFAVFSAFARNQENSVLDTARVFTSLSLFALLAEPLAAIIMAILAFMGSVGSFDRIQEFLQSEVQVDGRKIHRISGSDDTFSTYEKDSSCLDSDLSKEKIDYQIEYKTESTSHHAKNIFAIEDGAFRWSKESEPVLSSINMSVPQKKFTVIIGPVGCGKSSLLKAILGEMPFNEGTTYAPAAGIAYCEQSAWHMNGTIRESILGPQDLDKAWYDRVIYCCGLEQDFLQLPLADQTQIGSKGIALSGGQSQRIALARAIYAKKSVVILDDVLSGLDFDTENHVFHSLLGVDGLLRKAGVTVLVASSSTKRVPYADHVVSLNASGRICEQGSFEDLRRSGGYMSSFDIKPADWSYEHRPLEDKLKEARKEISAPPASPQMADILEDASRRTGDVKIYLSYIGSVGWPAALVFLVGISGFVFCFSFPNIWVKWWAQANAKAPNENLGYWLGVYAGLGVLAIICLVGACWQMIVTMIPLSGKSYHWTLLKTVLNAPMSFFSTTDTGVTINRFSQDLQLIDMELPLAALNTCAALILCIANMALIGVASYWAAISFPVCIITIYFVQKYYLRTSRQLRFLDIEAKSPLYSQFAECISGLATIRAFGWQSALRKINRQLLDRSQKPFYLLFAVQRWITIVLDLVVAALAVLLVVLVVALRGTISAGFVGVALLNVILFSQQVKSLVQHWTQLETHIGAIARIKTFGEETAAEHLDEESQIPPAQWPAEGAIEIRNFSAAYKVGDDVLSDVSMSVEAGQKIAVCGRTGSGKSSLTLALFQMISRTGGDIIIDSIPISQIPRNVLRARLNGVPQDPFTFTGTVRKNADPLGVSTEAVVIEALESVQLWDKIRERGGLDAEVDDLHFSQGQRQLFCLARALVRPGKVVVLDEVTSNVDGKTDAVLQRVLREKFSSHTVLSVSHRLDTILDYDKIALMDGGSLVEFDSPHALLSREDSAFRKLYYSASGNDDALSGSERLSSADADEIAP